LLANVASSVIPPWVSSIQRLQDNVFLNKSILETVGLDGPMIGMARNPQERKELAFKVGIITLVAFYLAPLHARLFAQLASHLHGQIDARLLCLGYEELTHTSALKQGLSRLKEELVSFKVKPLTLPEAWELQPETLRQNIVKAKTLLLTLDLGTEALFLMNVGKLKNWFGYLLTHKKQFTGEMGTVSSSDLDALYTYKEKQKREHSLTSKQTSYLLNTLALFTPTVIAQSFKHAFLNMNKQNSVLSALRKIAPAFSNDSRGFTLGLASFATAFVLLNIGEYTAARSDNEKVEIVVKKTPLFLSFMFGDLLLNRGLKRLFPPKGYTLQHTITQTLRQAPKALKAKAAQHAALTYLGAFTLNTGLVAAVIYAGNKITRKRLKQQVQHMKETQAPVIPPTPLRLNPNLVTGTYSRAEPFKTGSRPLPEALTLGGVLEGAEEGSDSTLALETYDCGVA
jgi:hypothetical protein